MSRTNHASNDPEDAVDLRNIISAVQQKLWLIIIFTVLGVGFGLAYLKLAIPIYEAQATLEVMVTSENAAGMESRASDLSRSDALGTVEANLARTSLFTKVIAREDVSTHPGLELPEELSQIERALELKDWTRVVLRHGARLIDVTVQHPDPEVAKLLANGIVEEYIRERAELESGTSNSAFEMLLAENRKIDDRLKGLEAALQAIEKVLSVKETIIEKEEALDEVMQTKGPLHPQAKAAQTLVDDLFDELEALLAKAHPLLESVSKAAQGGEEKVDGGGSPPGAETARPDRLKSEADLLELRERSLTRDIESERSVRDIIVGRLKEAEIGKDLESTPVAIVEPAYAAIDPVKPKPVQIIGLSTFLGIGIGVLLVWLLNALGGTLRTVDEAERITRLSVIGAIPFEKRLPSGTWLEKRKKRSLDELKRNFTAEFSKGSETAKGNAKKGKAKPPVKRRPTTGKIEPLVLLSDPGSAIAESFRSLRAMLTLEARQHGHKTFLVTSASPNEGKSFVAANVAFAFAAQEGKRTILVDADLRCPTVGSVFDLPPTEEGLASAIHSGGASVTPIGSGIPNLDILPAGARIANPAELLSSDAFAKVLSKLASEYDCVIVDTPPVNTVADALLLAAQVDSVLLVARAGATPRKAVIRAREALVDSGCSIAGLALTYLKARSGFSSNPYYYHYHASSKDYSRNYG